MLLSHYEAHVAMTEYHTRGSQTRMQGILQCLSFDIIRKENKIISSNYFYSVITFNERVERAHTMIELFFPRLEFFLV